MHDEDVRSLRHPAGLPSRSAESSSCCESNVHCTRTTYHCSEHPRSTHYELDREHTWSALKDGRADLVIGATNEPPAIPRLRWFELGTLDWVFAVALRHPLASVAEPLPRETIQQYRAAVVADTSQGLSVRTYGVQGGQEQLAVPTMTAKIAVQRAGLAVGWLPRKRVSQFISSGELVEKQIADQREPNTIYVAWRGEHTGKALDWWVERLREPHLMKRLVDGLEVR